MRHLGRYARGPVWATVVLVILLAVTSYYPFDWSPPRTVTNNVARTPDGTLVFGEQNVARSSASPRWLDSAQTSQQLRITLEVRPTFPQKHAPVSIMMFAQDFWHTNFAIGQDDTSLMLWLRREGSTQNGEPPFRVPRVFQPDRWTTVDLIISGPRLQVDINGRTRLDEQLSDSPLSTWEAGRIALGDEVHGSRPWQGAMRRAEVRTPSGAVDYVEPGALAVPEQYLYFPDRIAPFSPTSPSEWLVVLFHLVSFIPIGFLIARARRPLIRPVPAAAIAAGISVVLALGKFLFEERHASVADVIVRFLGALLGAYLAHWTVKRVSRSPLASRTLRFRARPEHPND